MHRKEAQDAKRAKRFTKILKEVTVAAKEGGPDPATNPRLRHALVQARQLNVPKANIERATNKSSEDKTYEALRRACEGFLGKCPPLAGVIRRDPHVAEAIREQTSIVSIHPKTKAVEDIQVIARRLLETV